MSSIRPLNATPATGAAADSSRLASLLWLVAFLLAAFNLRAPIIALGPMMRSLMDGLSISANVASLLTTIPILCFACISPLAPWLAARLGMDRSIGLALLTLALGVALRGVDSLSWVLLGTMLMGAGIACGNVYMPSFIKRNWPDRVGRMMGFYTVTMGVGATLAAATSVPLMQMTSSWQTPMWLWAAVATLALLVWLFGLWKMPTPAAAVPPRASLGGMLKSPLAWALTLFMGCQSTSFYTMQAWLSQVVTSEGATAAEAGVMLSVINLVTIPASFVVPMLATRLRSQSLLALIITLLIAAGTLGVMLSPLHGQLLWAVLLGVGQGASVSLAFTCMLLRSREVHHSALLSSMSQSIGYLLAATGPVLFGWLHELSGHWQWSMTLLIVLLVVQGVAGLICGRPRFVELHD
ncbi:hypothetical protein WH50_25410 [Pokkaliibacter plantistimulans]|uniref:Major facilitator superfamily (MFS) profile domain-containing protein n=1 Tax=Pokkaliibacter plantistimulans TaxID=1635171 RepID=A0ABX5LTW3_9GAMM|nr:MFS transporter [Pokkaliibacter plantistimulans]PXF28603.1 hypothetical protein WH50_25410 [Pokkaliibacter plantistimulans]